MNTRYTLSFTGKITAVTPLACTTPDVKGMPKLKIGDAERPYIPGSGIRGRLRHTATLLVCNAIMSHRDYGSTDGPYSYWDLLYNAVGGNKTSGSEDKNDILAQADRRSKNPLVSLFGAGDPWLAGRLRVGHAVPEEAIEPQVFKIVRQDTLARSPTALETMTPEGRDHWLRSAQATSQVTRLQAERENLKEELKKLKKIKDEERDADAKNQIDEMNARVKEIDDLIERLRKDMVSGNEKVKSQTLADYEFIPPGAVLAHRMDLQGVTPVEAGLFLAVLRDFALNPRLGGHAATGNGLVKFHYEIKTRPEAIGAPSVGWRRMGTLDFGPDEKTFEDRDFDLRPYDEASAELLLASASAWQGACERILADFDFSAPSRAA